MSSHSLLICKATENILELKIDTLKIKKSSIIIRAINHKLRQSILQIIGEQERITVTEIYFHLKVEQSVASQHLAILRKTGFVKTKREGKFIYYSVNKQKLMELNSFVDELLK